MKEEKFKVRDFRNKGFFTLDDAYLNGYAKYLGALATAVYISLCRHADKEQTCFPSQKKIAEEHGMTDRTVRTKIKDLTDWNIIRVESVRSKGGIFMSSIYFLLDKSEWKRPEEMISAGGSPEENHDSTRGKPQQYKDTQIKDTQLKNQQEPVGSGFKVYEKKKIGTIGDVLKKFTVPIKKPFGASYVWQDTAVRWWKKLGLDGKPTAGWFKLFKLDARLAERSCSWVSDSGGNDLERLTYWAFNKFKKEGKITYEKHN
jgi:biotin operon repressor